MVVVDAALNENVGELREEKHSGTIRGLLP